MSRIRRNSTVKYSLNGEFSRNCNRERELDGSLVSPNRWSVRQGKRESCANSGSAVHADIALHQLQIFLHDVQSQAETIEVAGVCLSQLMEFLKDPAEVLFFDPNPGIGHGKFEAFFLLEVSYSYRDVAPGRKFMGVADEVLQNFL
jgi:hypothetical protein